MRKQVLVEKSSGEKEPFSESKLRNSLTRAGAGKDNIEWILDKITDYIYEGVSTHQIYKKAFLLLRRQVRSTAARYSLKKAIMELGPTGYPFEQFIGALLAEQGFKVKVGEMVTGKCVQHEVDVIAENENHQYMIECKFHNQQGNFCDVKVSLYIHSRFLDIKENWLKNTDNNNKNYQGWIVTNTRFTSDAINYGKCVGLKLVGWDYPVNGGLKDWINQTGLFPITAITSLSRKEKQALLDKGIILCRHIHEDPSRLTFLGLSLKNFDKVVEEAKDLCISQLGDL
jgi:hypothetical protein